MSFKWKDEYSVNVIEIDNQHKRLLELGDELVDLAMGNQDIDYYDNIVRVLEELKNYTVYHFGYEEEMMKKYNYNGNEKQSFEHMFFIKKVEKLVRRDVDGQQREVIMDLLNFVADWISSHILLEDKKFGEYLNSIGFN